MMLRQITQIVTRNNVKSKNVCFRYFCTNKCPPLSNPPPPGKQPCKAKEDPKDGCKMKTSVKICENEVKNVTVPCEEIVCKKKKVCEKKQQKKEEAKVLKAINIEPLMSNNLNDSKIVIIGAGLAGLAAGKYLEENNIRNYVILEAQGWPGGRIHSQWFSDTIVELGAKCARVSTDSSSFVQAAMADGFIKPPFSCMSIFKTCDGNHINSTISVIAYEIHKRIYQESLNLETNPLDYIAFRIEQEVSTFPKHIRSDVKRVLLGILAMQYKKEGDNLKQFVSRGKGVCYLQCPGSNVKVPLGYYGIMQPLLDRIPKEKIKLSKPVQNVRWGAVVCKGAPRAFVKCSDGTVYPADYVLITVSLGVLKERHSTLFCPELPSETVDVIKDMGYLHKNNIFFQFCKPFWSWGAGNIDICYTSEESEHLTGWKKGLRLIQQVPTSNDVLGVTVIGNEAVTLEKLSESTIFEGVKEEIECKMNIKGVPPIKATLRSLWSSNGFFNGAYSYLPFGMHDGEQQILGNPLPGNNAPVDPILFFAGEATCPKLSGTVQAAKISGIREAARIKKIMTNSTSLQTTEQKLAASL